MTPAQETLVVLVIGAGGLIAACALWGGLSLVLTLVNSPVTPWLVAAAFGGYVAFGLSAVLKPKPTPARRRVTTYADPVIAG